MYRIVVRAKDNQVNTYSTQKDGVLVPTPDILRLQVTPVCAWLKLDDTELVPNMNIDLQSDTWHLYLYQQDDVLITKWRHKNSIELPIQLLTVCIQEGQIRFSMQGKF